MGRMGGCERGGFKKKKEDEIEEGLGGSERCIRERREGQQWKGKESGEVERKGGKLGGMGYSRCSSGRNFGTDVRLEMVPGETSQGNSKNSGINSLSD